MRYARRSSLNTGLKDEADFVLAFYMVHEVPDKKALFKQVYELLKTGGKLLIIEPAFHVKKDEFKGTMDCAHTNGFETQVFSRGFMDLKALLVKTG